MPVLTGKQLCIVTEALREALTFVAERQEDQADGFAVRLNLQQALAALGADAAPRGERTGRRQAAW
jgi:hypothetical protein